MKKFLLISLFFYSSIGFSFYSPLGEYPYINCHTTARDVHVQILKQQGSEETRLALFATGSNFVAAAAEQSFYNHIADRFYVAKSESKTIELYVYLTFANMKRANSYMFITEATGIKETQLYCSVVQY